MDTLQALEEVIAGRREQPEEGSYTAYLFEKGLDKILKKVGEECAEVIIAAKNGQNTETVGELADLTYHLLVLMNQQGIALSEVEAVLADRAKKSGNLKKPRAAQKSET